MPVVTTLRDELLKDLDVAFGREYVYFNDCDRNPALVTTEALADKFTKPYFYGPYRSFIGRHLLDLPLYLGEPEEQ